MIGYQDTPFNESTFIDDTLAKPAAKKTNRYNPDLGLVEPLTNFYDFEPLRKKAVWEVNPGSEGVWKFKFEWQLENQVLGELVWTQKFPPVRVQKLIT